MAKDDIDGYRAEARGWLRANLELRPDAPLPRREVHGYTAEYLAEQRSIQRRLFEGGYTGITWPVRHGGQGLTAAHEQAFLDEAKRFRLPDFGVLAMTTFGSCAPTMIDHASAEFLDRHLPRIMAGDELWCQFFSEPEAGSDLAGVRTRADRDGDRWRLNGGKVWSTFAHLADWGMCLTRTNWDVPKHRGLTWFAVPTDAEGVTVRPIVQIDGTEEFCEEFFDDVSVDDRERIGHVDGGWAVTSTLLVYERGAGRPETAERLGAPPALAPDLVAAARRAGTTGSERVRQLIATAHVNDHAVALLKARIATMARLGEVHAGVASYGKLAAATYGPLRACIAMEVAGAGAVAWDSDDGDDVARGYLNGRKPAVAGGTIQMQRNGISEGVLGMPRERNDDRDKPFAEVVRSARNWTGS